MSFDLTNKNIQDTFQKLLQQTGSVGEVYDLEGNRVTNVNINTISSSTVSASTIVFGDGTSQITAGGGISNLIEDTTPQLGGNLDLKTRTISGSGAINFSGSLQVVTENGTDDFFLLKSGSLNSLKVNNQGVVVLGGFTFEPTAIKGGLYYNDSDDEFYAGKNN